MRFKRTYVDGIDFRGLPMTHRIDYDAVAEAYDNQPFRQKEVDRALVSFLEALKSSRPHVLDVCCGTGNQIIANRAAIVEPKITWVGLDQSRGMLKVARRKCPKGVTWTQGDITALPFKDKRFHYISCQYALHHTQNKATALLEVHRVLRKGGCFVLQNVCPREMADQPGYVWFPESYAQDLKDFWPRETTIRHLETLGFDVTANIERPTFSTTLAEFARKSHNRSQSSQLTSISDDAYTTSLQRLEEAAAQDPERVLTWHVALLEIRATLT